mgnify:CR=1 FL=1
MNTRLYYVVSNMEKQGSFASIASSLAKNPGAVGGGVLGGAYGAYKGSQGEEGGLKGGILGGLQGAAGGAIIGGVGQKAGKALLGSKGQKGVIGQYRDATQAANEAAKRNLGKDARTGLFSNFRNRRAYAKTQDKELGTIKKNVQHIMDKSEASLISPKAGRDAIDAEMKKHVLTNRSKLKDQLIFGTIGTAMAGSAGAKLIREGAKAGQPTDRNKVNQNLAKQYRQTGKLDPRQVNYLTQQL